MSANKTNWKPEGFVREKLTKEDMDLSLIHI